MHTFVRYVLRGVVGMALALAATAQADAQFITPNPGSTSAPAFTSGRTVWFDVEHPVDLLPFTHNLSCSYTSPVESCSVSPSTMAMQPGEIRQALVTFSVGAPGEGTVTLASDGGGSGYYNVTVYDPRGPASLAPGTSGLFKNPGICVAACGDATLAYSAPAYTSLDVARSITLAYNSGTVAPRGFVHLVASDFTSLPPPKMSLKLRDAGQQWVPFLNGSTELFFASGSGSSHLAGQFTLPNSATGSYAYTAVVTSYWNDGTTRIAEAPDTRVTVLNETDSPYGAGWNVAGLLRLRTSGQHVLVSDGTGGIVLATFNYTDGGGTTFYNLPVWEYGQLKKRPAPGAGGILYDRTYPDGSVARFDTAGLLREVADRFANTTTYGYDASKRLTSVTDAAGQMTTLAYRQTGAGGWKVGTLETITTPGGRVSTFFVNAAGDLVQVTDPDGVSALVATYDAEHRLTSRSGRLGADWKLSYDFAGKVAADSTPAVSVVGKPGPIRLVTKIRSLARDVLIESGSGFGTSANPAPRRTPDSVRVEVTDSRGHTTKIAVSQYGVPTRVESPIAGATVLERSDGFHVTREISPGADTLDYTWVYPGNVSTAYHRNAQARVQYEYDAAKFYQLTRVSGDGVDTVWHYYGAAGNRDSTRIGKSTDKVRKFTYDARGRVITASDELGHTSFSFFGAAGWQNIDSTRAGTGNRVIKFAYGDYGRSVRITHPTGRRDSVTYDLLNRVRSEHGPLGHRLDYGYAGSLGAADSLTDARGERYLTYANALGWVERQADPNGREDRFAYDTVGNGVEWRNRRGQLTTLAFDSLGRVTERRLSDGRVTTFAYDAEGRLSRATNSESDDSWTVAHGPLSSFTSHTTARTGVPSYSVHWDYDFPTRSSRVRLSWEVGGQERNRISTRQWNERGLLTSAGPSGNYTGISHDDDGKPTQIGRYGQISQTLAYRVTDALISSTASVNEWTASFAHDILGRVIERRSANADTLRAFYFDSLGRLVSAVTSWRGPQVCPALNASQETDGRCTDQQPFSGTTIRQGSYSYDAVGNRLTGTVAPGNRMTFFNGDSLAYDDDGNLTRKWRAGFDQRFYWNSINQLDSVSTTGVGMVKFGYDGVGRRVRKTTPTQTIRYVYDGEQMIAELDAAGMLLKAYSFSGIDQPLAVETGSGVAPDAVYHFVTDQLGNVTALKAADGQIVSRYTHGPFGEALAVSESVANALRFAGREYDAETKLYYNRARYYDPSSGRFISEDPIGLAGGVNTYAYAGNDPVNLRDPSGLCYESWESRYPADAIPSNAVVVTATINWGLCQRILDMLNWANAKPMSLSDLFGQDADQWWLQDRSCSGGGFTDDQCLKLDWTITALEHHPRMSCRAYGRAARVQFENRLFSLWRNAPEGTYGDVGWVFGTVRIAPKAFENRGQLGHTIAHEMYHWIKRVRDSQTDPGLIDRLTQECKMPVW